MDDLHVFRWSLCVKQGFSKKFHNIETCQACVRKGVGLGEDIVANGLQAFGVSFTLEEYLRRNMREYVQSYSYLGKKRG